MTDADIATCGVDTRSEKAPDPRGCAGVCACSETEAAGLVLVAPHDPVGLLVQLQQRAPDSFDVEYFESGPEAWRLSLIRQKA